MITNEQAISILEELLGYSKCNDAQIMVFKGSWENKNYKQIASETGYQYDYVKQVGCALWRSLSEITGQTINKHNVRRALKYYQKKRNSNVTPFPKNSNSKPSKTQSVKEQVNPFLYAYRVG
ncbi:MAG: hypothetical protein ACRC6M_10960 [Microcystaceae cyanobacterium]